MEATHERRQQGATLVDDWGTVHERARTVHLLAGAGADYRELARVADRDLAVIVAAISYESDDRRDYALMSAHTVRYRLTGLLDLLTEDAA